MDAIDKWKCLAVNITDRTLPRVHAILDHVSTAVDPVAFKSLMKQTEAAISVIKITFAILSSLLFIIFIIFLNISMEQSTQILHSNYVQLQYGGTVETMARTYANLMKFHCDRVRRNGIGIGTEGTNVLLIGAGDTVEAYLRYDDQFSSDETLQSLLLQGQPFVFGTIKDALHMLDVYCTSEKKPPKTLFILLLISTRDPSQGHHEHETFQMPSSLRDHYYAIVGTGTGGKGVPAHKLSKTSQGPNGKPLTKNLPLGPRNAGVCF